MKVSMTHDRGTHNLKIENDGIVNIRVSSFTAVSGCTLYDISVTVTDRYGTVYMLDRKVHPANLTTKYASNIVIEMGEKSYNTFDSLCSDIAMCFFKTIFYHFAI